MAQELLTCDIIVKDALPRLENYLVIAATCNRAYSEQFGNFNGMPRGYTITVREPTIVESVTGPVITDFNYIEQQGIEIKADTWITVPLQISTADFQLELNDFTDNFSDPVMARMGNDADIALIDAGINSFNKWVGSPTSDLNSFAGINAAQAKLTKFGIPKAGRYACISVKDYESLSNSLQNTYNEPLNKAISQDASPRRVAGFDLFQDQNLKPHTVGGYAGTPKINGAAQSGSALDVDGWTGSLNKGDRFTIDGVYSLNPSSFAETGELMQFLVTDDVNAGTDIPIYPAIVLTGPYRNVSNAPADNANVNILGDADTKYMVGFAYNKTAFTLGCIKLQDPRTAPMAGSFGDAKTKLAISMSGQYDEKSRTDQYRYDMLLAIKAFGAYGTAIISKYED